MALMNKCSEISNGCNTTSFMIAGFAA